MKELLELVSLLKESLGDTFYNGPNIGSKSYYHPNQIEAHENALKVGAYANSLSKSGDSATRRQAHLKAAKAHRYAAKQLGTFGGVREHMNAAEAHEAAAKKA